MANITSHNQTTTNHTKILTQVHIWIETFVSLRYDYILNIIHKVKLHEEVKAGHVLYPWDRSHLQLGPPNREVPTLTPSIDAMKYKGEWWGGRKYIIRVNYVLGGRVVVVIVWYPLTKKSGNVIIRHSDLTTAWREDGQGSLFVLLIYEYIYPLLWWDHCWSYGGVKVRSLKIEKVFFRDLLCDIHHPIGGIEFLIWEILMTHDEWVGLWTPPPHHPKILPYNHQPLHPLTMSCVRLLVPDEGGGVQHPVDCRCFGPMDGSEAHGSWHCVSLIFTFSVNLRSMEWPATYYQNSLVFMNENVQKVAQVSLLMNYIIWKIQRLTYMFNIRYGCFHNQLISW